MCVCGGGGIKTLAQATQDIKNDLCAYRVIVLIHVYCIEHLENNPASGFC